MESFAANLRKRAKALGLSHAEVARRVGISDRRYAHYVSGRNEPDLALMVRIAGVLKTTPDALLGVGEDAPEHSRRRLLLERLNAAATAMSEDDLELAVAQAEAVVAVRSR